MSGFAESTGAGDEGAGGSSWRIRALSILVMMVLAGMLPFLSHYLRVSTWLLWGLMILIIASFGSRLSLGRLMWPLAAYLCWLCFYFAWGSIVAGRLDTYFIIKTLGITALLGATMAILSASPRNLRTFATTIQFAVIINILVLLLSSLSSQVDAVVRTVTMRSAAMEGGFQRYGGLWGNPNLGAYICLVVLIFSAFAVPWAGLLGRLSCLPIFYLSASRKGAILLVVITLLYMAIVHRRNVKAWMVALALILAGVLAFTFGGALRKESRSSSPNAYFARMMDVKESNTAERGEATRIDLFNDWMAVVAVEPWYGYGLNAMIGTQFDEEHPTVMTQKGLVDNGTHNTYLGVWVDVGPFGFCLFMLMIAYYLRKCLTAPATPRVRWVLVSFALVNLVFLFVSHSQLTSFEGEIIYTLLFLLPTSPAVRAQMRLPGPDSASQGRLHFLPQS
ncbi:O-antigen ligase [Geothrix sp. 21YS21S-2]|uniref:O-antigen ligase family protein n=1 Tax=Geothrix sp. 21YS21S-2 TaxID=3068893 RepID=UPI0027B97A68|nr:O-antigen ligase family protein [Geothrix sp. 21YS21S-2]